MGIQVQRGMLRYVVPQYDEIALFAMSLTCALLLFAAATSENLDIHISPGEADIRLIAALLVFFSGLVLSIYHAFTDRPKTTLEKSFMLYFAVLLNSFSGVMAGMYDLATASGLLILFPVWNIINGVASYSCSERAYWTKRT